MKLRVIIPTVIVIAAISMTLFAFSPKGQRLRYDLGFSSLRSVAIGRSETELRAIFPEIGSLEPSFANLVSKNLHPYHAPPDHYFLRLGNAYTVFELKDGLVLAVHKVHG